MRKILLAAALALGALAPARASQISASCSADSVQLFCNGVTPGATVQWTAQHYFFQPVTFGSTSTGAGFSIISSSGIQMQTGFLVIGAGGVVWADGSVSTSAFSGGGGGGGPGPWSEAGGVIYPTTAGSNVLVFSTLTVAGNAFSVGGATVAVLNGRLGVGTANPGRPLHVIGAGGSNGSITTHSDANTAAFFENAGDVSINVYSGHNFLSNVFLGDTVTDGLRVAYDANNAKGLLGTQPAGVDLLLQTGNLTRVSLQDNAVNIFRPTTIVSSSMTAEALLLENNTVASSTPMLNIVEYNTNQTGDLIHANANASGGGSMVGNLINLQIAGVSVFVVTSSGNVIATTFTATGSAFIVGGTTIQANSANFGGTGDFAGQVTMTQSGAMYSLVTASGVFVVGGGVTAPFFNGIHLGDGSQLSGTASAATVAALGISTNSLQNQVNTINASTGSFVTGSGTANKLTKWASGVAVSSSQITDDGTDINATAKAAVTGGMVTVNGGAGTTGFGGAVNVSGGDSATNQGGNLNLSSGNGAVQPGSVIAKIGGVEEARVHINGYLGVNQASPPARLSVVDIGGINTFTGADNNYLLVLATGDPVGKWVMAVTTSGKVSFGGLDPALQTNKYTLNGGTLAVTGAISSTGTISANNFMGDGFHLNNLVVAASSAPVGSISIASTAEITVTTVTAAVRGGRPYMLSFTVDINNAFGATRTYTLRLKEEGALVSGAYINDVTGSSNKTLHIHALVTAGAGAAGSRNFEATIQGSSGVGTQTADARELSIVEY